MSRKITKEDTDMTLMGMTFAAVSAPSVGVSICNP